LHTLFAACALRGLEFPYPAGTLRGGLLSLEDRCGGIRSRIRRKPFPGPQAVQPEQKISQKNQAPKPAPATWEEKTAMSTDALRPLGATADRATARLGSSLHVKGEITGNEDLQIDGSVEGLVQLDERKLTVGATLQGDRRHHCP